ncbi:MAG: CooT family nickel-binding protein [Candidatus Methanomethylophilaceae archaeon]|jgi:predicted RNA-binding protein|nr:CooT family nickel-binding protein [Candidatus Methanomethylophilaceae archaeon]MBR3410290.1 CooT family nickel-binding protein [Candidatus Methanomethylophilaceae archaeon]
MCEFTVYLNGREDSDVVATNVIKSKIREGNVSLMDSSGKTYRIENADIMTVDSIMAEMHLRSRA